MKNFIKKNKRKIILSSIVLLSIIVSFFVGFFVGKSINKPKTFKEKFTTFYQIKKLVGKKVDKKEQEALRMFIVPYEECIRNDLDKFEKEKLIEIQDEVIDLAKNNEKVKFKIKNLKSAKNEKKLIKKVKKCQKKAYKSMQKDKKKLFKKALSKLELSNIIAIYHGIR